MKDNKVTIIGVCFFLLCLGLAGGIYFIDGQLRELREQYDDLERRRANLVRETSSLREEITVYTNAFDVLESYNVRATDSDMDFYAQVQEKIEENHEVSIISARQNGIRDGRTSISLTLRGDYYAFMRILASWRNLYTTVRVSELSIQIPRNPQVRGEIQADVVVEAIVSAR
jgi:hypothetical protein